MSDASLALISGALSGGFALAGVGLSNFLSTRRGRSAFGQETALELAGMERLVWGDSWIELTTHLQRHEARWAIAGLPDQLIRDFHGISIARWEDLQKTVERSAGQHPGIGKGLLDARQAVHEAARAYLLRSGTQASREELAAQASQTVETVLAER